MSLGLPSRTANTTTELDTMPLVGAVVPGVGDETLVDEPRDVAGDGEVHVVGRQALGHGPALVAGGAVGAT